MGTETNKSGTEEATSVIVIDTDYVEDGAAKISDSCEDLRKAYGPIPEAREKLTALNTDGCLTKALQHLYDAEVAYYKHTGQLETAAVMLRNIAVNYDNTEQLLLGGDTRDMIKPPKPPEIAPYKPGPDEKKPKYDTPEWKWDKREGGTKWDEVKHWYDYPFDAKHKINIGQKKKWHSPTDGTGSYLHQRQLAWNAGVTYDKWKYDPQLIKKDDLKAMGFLKEWDTQGDEKFAAKKIGTFFEASVGASASYTLLGTQYTNVKDYSSIFAEAYMVRAQASAQAGVGAFLYKTADDRYVKACGFAASAAASFTVAGADLNFDGGTAWIGGGGTVDAKLLNVYAKGDLIIGMVDGKFNAVASGSVGCDFASVSVSPMARVLGCEVSGTLGLTVGVSAKFEVGFHDGKFKANIGASLGLGIDISLSLDCSKCWSVMKDIGKGVASVARKIFRRW